MAENIAKDLIHIRVDIYDVDGKLFIGELTLYNAAGFCEFQPPEYDEKFGQLLELPKLK